MDRRGNDRRTPPPAAEQGSRPSGDSVDVEQIMREIQSRVSQRHGIELTPQQIQELAARRLEAILDPRTVNPTLFDQLRKGAAVAPDPLPQAADGVTTISDDAIYEGGPVLRFFRRLLNPLLKLLFNPAALTAALQAQARISREITAQAAERERRQTEWNALHYQILQRLVTEVSRNSIEVQALATRVEALAARVDFNDRRVRTLENTPAANRRERPPEPVHPAPTPEGAVSSESSGSPVIPGATAAPLGDGPRRKRRRRRGRRGATSTGESLGAPTSGFAAGTDDLSESEDTGDDEMQNGSEPAEAAAASTPEHAAPDRVGAPVAVDPAVVAVEPAAAPEAAPAETRAAATPADPGARED